MVHTMLCKIQFIIKLKNCILFYHFSNLKGVGIGEYVYGIGKILGDPYARQGKKSVLMDGMEEDCARQRAQFYFLWL